MRLVKAHALGNDFLLLEASAVPAHTDRVALARAVCSRHRGIGADGLILYGPLPSITMHLLNADGSYSEVSGNGVRCLAAWIATESHAQPGDEIAITTDAGLKRLTLLERRDNELRFRAAMGMPEQISSVTLHIGDMSVDAVTLRVGNPQCVVLGDVTLERLHGVAARLAVHPHFPHGTNVELASVVAPDRVRILIWERGVGPTEASGTGACAAAVAAMSYGNAARDVLIESPGGVQRVEWLADGLYLTGTAEMIAVCNWERAVDN